MSIYLAFEWCCQRHNSAIITSIQLSHGMERMPIVTLNIRHGHEERENKLTGIVPIGKVDTVLDEYLRDLPGMYQRLGR